MRAQQKKVTGKTPRDIFLRVPPRKKVSDFGEKKTSFFLDFASWSKKLNAWQKNFSGVVVRIVIARPEKKAIGKVKCLRDLFFCVFLVAVFVKIRLFIFRDFRCVL